MDPTPAEFKSRRWVYKYAVQMFENGLTGNCYGMASAVAAVAKELGYQPYVITLAEGHSFVMINGRYYALLILAVGCMILFIVSVLQERGIRIRETLSRCSLPVTVAIYFCLLLSIGFFGSTAAVRGFIYAQF